MSRPIYQIAQEIADDWCKNGVSKVNYGAEPYLAAMFQLTNIDDKFYLDSGSSVVAYFLANASTWRGPKAREIKKELNAMLKG